MILFFSFPLTAQRKSAEFIAPCGPPIVGKYIPVDEKEIELVAQRYPNLNIDSARIHLTEDLICNEGKPLDLVTYLNNNPLTKIEISAHVHSKSTEINKTITWANNIRDYLIENGIEESRIIAIGKGKKELLISDQQLLKAKTVPEQEKIKNINQRVEIKILMDGWKPYFSIADQQFFSGQKLDKQLGDQLSRQYDYLFMIDEHKQTDIDNPAPTDTAYRVLNILAVFLQTHPQVKIEIGVYSDSRGDANSNLRLTHARANAIMKILTGKGVKPTQMIATGYGEKDLLISDNIISKLPDEKSKEAAHRQNRRIVIRIK